MIVIDYQDRRPIYEQLVERVQLLIIKGVLKPDDQLPSVRKLAVDLSINPNTIQKAYSMLEQQGFLYPVKGRGMFVASDPEKGMDRKKDEFFDQLQELIQYAKDLKITKEDFMKKADRYYGEVQND